MALTVAVAAAQAVERIGMPESQIILSQAVTYVASAPKSNAAVNAIFAATEAVKNIKRLYRHICRMLTIREQKSWGMEQATNMHMIIRDIMWNSSIFRTK